ncbi:MAG: hypothetical protein ABW104_12370 [Candidatus Thiodiazotropha sp. 6PLUC2]
MILEKGPYPQTLLDCFEDAVNTLEQGKGRLIDYIPGKKKVVHHLTNETMDYHDSAYAESSPP